MRTLTTRWKIWGMLGVLIVVLAIQHRAQADFGLQGGDIGPADQGLKTLVVSLREKAGGGLNNALGGPVYIKGFKLIAEAAGQCALYDATEVPHVSTQATTGLVDDLAEATAGDTNAHIWPSPIRFETAVSVAVTGANNTCIVYY